MRKCSLFILSILITINALSQSDKDAFFIKSIYTSSLTESNCYKWLGELCTKAGPRLSGSKAANKAVNFTEEIMMGMNFDKVWLQECMVPYWTRGEKEKIFIEFPDLKNPIKLRGLSLGNSGSAPKGKRAKVVEVNSLEALEKLEDAFVKDKIIFFNRPMDPSEIRTFNAYGKAVDQRVYGPARSAAKGAVACLVRSITTSLDTFPHTGTTVFQEGVNPIPAIAISTMDADLLSNYLKETNNLEVYVENHCKSNGLRKSYNVIGEKKGTTYPNEIILVGGHLDAWDVGQGAHDDGAGCVHALEVMNTLNNLNYQPQRTLRVVLFMNEENGLAGGLKYAEISNKNKEFHVAAIESDSGGFTPKGFSCTADKSVFPSYLKALSEKFKHLESYDLYLKPGGAGADINPLRSQGGLLVGFRPDSQRYFDFHHTPNDTFDKVNKRELELGAAAITSLVYLIDRYGLK